MERPHLTTVMGNKTKTTAIQGILLAVTTSVVVLMIIGHMINYTHAQNKSTLQLSTNKKTYRPGETVAMTVKNNGKSSLEFPDSTLGLTIQNTKTHQKAGILAVQVMSEL